MGEKAFVQCHHRLVVDGSRFQQTPVNGVIAIGSIEVGHCVLDAKLVNVPSFTLFQHSSIVLQFSTPKLAQCAAGRLKNS